MARTPPAHWIEATGPNQWFTLWHPPSWSVEQEDDASILLRCPDAAGRLRIVCRWSEDESTVPAGQLVALDKLFLKTRKVRERTSPQVGEQCVELEGEGVNRYGIPWWKRLLRQYEWRRFRVWGVVHRNVYLLGLFVGIETFDPEAATLASLIMSTLSFREQPACPPEVFSQQVLDLARKHFPHLECEAAPEFQIRIGETRINLTNFYRSYLNAPDQFERILLQALNTTLEVQSWGKSQTTPGLDVVRSRIMPMLYPEEVWQERHPELVATPWVAGLVVVYVVDESQAYWFIRRDLMQSWQLSADELHALAITNLQKYFHLHPMEYSLAGEEDGPRLWMPSRPDAYNASRLLCEPFLDSMRDVLATPFAVGIPSRDFLVGVSLHSQSAVEHVRRRVAVDYGVMDHPLCRKLLLVTRDGVTELIEDAAEGSGPVASDDADPG